MSAQDISQVNVEYFIPLILREQFFHIIENTAKHVVAKCQKCPPAGSKKGVIKGQPNSTGNFIRHYKVKNIYVSNLCYSFK